MTGPAGAGALRSVVLVASVAGLLTLVAAGLLPMPIAAGAGVLLGGASALSAWASSAAAHRWRHRASAVLIVIVGLLVVASVDTGRIETPGPALALVLVAVMVIHALGLDGLRDLLVASAVTLASALLAVGLAPGPVIVAPLLLTWMAVVAAFTLAHREQQAVGVLAVAIPAVPVLAPRAARRAVLARLTGTVAVTVAMGLVAFLLVPDPSGLAGRSGLLGALSRSGGEGSGAVGNRSGASYAGSTLDLRVRGELGESPVLEVPADSPALWRGTVFDTYDGTRWTGRVGAAQPLPGGPVYLLPPEGGNGAGFAGPAGLAGLPGLPGGRRSDEVRVREGFGDVLVAPGLATQVRADAGLLRAGSGELVLTERVAAYGVESIPSVHDAAVLRSARGADPADPRWLALPASLPGRVRDVAVQVTAGTGGRHDAVLAVESYLRATATYRLDSPVPGRGVDAVDDFLFVSRTGFCEQYAAAEVVMLRAVGIPARLVTGYAYGDPVEGGRLMRARNAHAWVEVWFPAVGWSASDPTAGATLARTAPPDALDRAAAAGRRLLADDARRTVVAMGLLVVLLGGGVAARFRAGCAGRRRAPGRWRGTDRWGRRVGRTWVEDPPARPLLTALGRLETALAEAGTPRGPAESVTELAVRLAVDDSVDAFEVLERDCFGDSPVPVARARAAAEAIDRVTQCVRAAEPVTPVGRSSPTTPPNLR